MVSALHGRLALLMLSMTFAAGAHGQLAEVIYTNIDGHPTAQVPGVPGEAFRAPLVPFLALHGSPDGSGWIFKAFTDNPDSDRNDVIVVGSGLVGTTVAREGDPAPGTAGLVYGFFDSDCGINDSGHYVFGNRLSGSTPDLDESLFRSTGGAPSLHVLESDAAPGLVDPPGTMGDELFGNSLNSVHLLNDDTVCYRADIIQNVDSDYESALYVGLTPVVQEGTSAREAGGAVYDGFVALSGNTFSHDADGKNWIVEADLAPGLDTDEAVVLTGTVVVRDGDSLPGEGSPVDAIFAVDLAGNGDWFARGEFLNENAWAVRNGAIIAATSQPIIPDASEKFIDSIQAVNGNSVGDYVVVGSTNADASINQVAVINGTEVIIRRGDPVDLDGNGVADDDLFVDTIAAEDVILTNPTDGALALYFFCSLRNGAGADLGDAFLRVTMAGDDCDADLNGDGDVGPADLAALLDAWGPNPGNPADLNGDGDVGPADLAALLDAWGTCP